MVTRLLGGFSPTKGPGVPTQRENFVVEKPTARTFDSAERCFQRQE
jgi:hypothetical protein